MSSDDDGLGSGSGSGSGSDEEVDYYDGDGSDVEEDSGDRGCGGGGETKGDGSSSRPVKIARQNSFEVYEQACSAGGDALADRSRALMEDTSEYLGVSPCIAGVLLRHYHWQKQKLLDAWMQDDGQTVRVAAGLEPAAPPVGGGGGGGVLPPDTVVGCPVFGSDDCLDDECMVKDTYVGVVA